MSGECLCVMRFRHALRQNALRTSVSKNFAPVRRLGIRRNGIRRIGIRRNGIRKWGRTDARVDDNNPRCAITDLAVDGVNGRRVRWQVSKILPQKYAAKMLI